MICWSGGGEEASPDMHFLDLSFVRRRRGFSRTHKGETRRHVRNLLPRKIQGLDEGVDAEGVVSAYEIEDFSFCASFSCWAQKGNDSISSGLEGRALTVLSSTGPLVNH